MMQAAPGPDPSLPPLTKLSIVIPARDEEGCIASTVEHLHLELQLHGVPHEIVVVDDGSTRPHVGDPAGAAGARCRSSRRRRTPGPTGSGAPSFTGSTARPATRSAIMMADESDDCRDVVRYWRTLNEGWECVFGSRFVPGGGVIDYPWLKYRLNRLANLFIRLLFRIPLNDTTNAFKAYRRTAIRGLPAAHRARTSTSSSSCR